MKKRIEKIEFTLEGNSVMGPTKITVIETVNALIQAQEEMEKRVDFLQEQFHGHQRASEPSNLPTCSDPGPKGGGCGSVTYTVPVSEPKEECTCGGSAPGAPHMKDCPLYEPKEECKHCHFPIDKRNPSGYCDHLYYPENCDVCNGKFVSKEEPNQIREKLKKIINEIYMSGCGKEMSEKHQESNADDILALIQ